MPDPVVDPIVPVVPPVSVVVPPVVVVEPPVTEIPPVVEPPVVEEPSVVVPPVTEPPKVLISKEEAQKRIDRMYARLQTERGARTAVETDYSKLKNRIKVDPDTGEEVVEREELTQKQVEAIWERKENEKKFKESETKVLLRHPGALNEDGSFNMNDSFTKEYIDVGRNNQALVFMINGPELAEAMVEKKLGIKEEKITRSTQTAAVRATNATTGASTVAVNATVITKLPDFKAKIARRMGMTEQQYIDYETKIKKGDRRVQ